MRGHIYDSGCREVNFAMSQLSNHAVVSSVYLSAVVTVTLDYLTCTHTYSHLFTAYVPANSTYKVVHA